MSDSEANSIVQGYFIHRPNRFLGIVQIGTKEVEVFVPNPGRMTELLTPEKKVYLRYASASHRKTDYDMIAVKHDDLIVSIDSNLPNRFMKKHLQNHRFDFIEEYTHVKSEPAMYGGRFDFLLEGRKKKIVIEVKSCTLVEDGHTFFPDAPTKRGARHMRHLAQALKEQLVDRALVVFVIQRPDARVFSPNDPTDPNFGEALRFAQDNGVEVFALRTELVDWDLKFLGQVPVNLEYFLE